MAPPKKMSEENSREILKEVSTEILLEEISTRLKEQKVPIKDYSKVVDIFYNTFLKKTGLEVPHISRARKCKGTTVSLYQFIYDLDCKLRDENKLTERSSEINKIYGVMLMHKYPNEWKELAESFEATGKSYKPEEEF